MWKRLCPCTSLSSISFLLLRSCCENSSNSSGWSNASAAMPLQTELLVHYNYSVLTITTLKYHLRGVMEKAFWPFLCYLGLRSVHVGPAGVVSCAHAHMKVHYVGTSSAGTKGRWAKETLSTAANTLSQSTFGGDLLTALNGSDDDVDFLLAFVYFGYLSLPITQASRERRSKMACIWRMEVCLYSKPEWKGMQGQERAAAASVR
jgi:hypothetical protein